MGGGEDAGWVGGGDWGSYLPWGVICLMGRATGGPVGDANETCPQSPTSLKGPARPQIPATPAGPRVMVDAVTLPTGSVLLVNGAKVRPNRARSKDCQSRPSTTAASCLWRRAFKSESRNPTSQPLGNNKSRAGAHHPPPKQQYGSSNGGGPGGGGQARGHEGAAWLYDPQARAGAARGRSGGQSGWPRGPY
jgi:hypothetical protein